MAQYNRPPRSFATRPSSNDGSEGVSPASDDHKEQFSNLDDISNAASRYNAANVNPLLMRVVQLEDTLKRRQAEFRELELKNEQLTSRLNALRLRVVLHFPVWAFTGAALVSFESAVGSGNWVGGVAWACAIVIGLLCIGNLFFSKKDNT